MNNKHNPEIIKQPEDHTCLIVGNFESLSPELQAQWLAVRLYFMGKYEDWHPKDENGIANDYDVYDKDPETIQTILQDEQGKIIAGIRLTPQVSIYETLSRSMLSKVPNDAFQGVEGPVWDITRLVPGPGSKGKSAEEKIAVFTELFAAGFASILENGEEHPLWVFVSYCSEDKSSFVVDCEKYGMKFTPVEGAQQDDIQLYCADPRELIQFMRDNQEQYPKAWSSAKKAFDRVLGGDF